MNRQKSSVGVRQNWPERLRELVLGGQTAEPEIERRLHHRRGMLAAMIAAPAAAVLIPGSSAEAAPARGSNAAEFRSIRNHENEHVDFLVTALGAAARPMPTFQNLEQRRFIDFVRVAQTLENTGVGAYLGAAYYLKNPDFLAAAGSIAFIEARHAGFLNVYVGDPITGTAADPSSDNAFEDALTDDEVVAGAGVFIKSLNGGPPVAYDDVESDDNDVKILNFALALEYLEAEFYNINVPKFFKGR